MLALGRTFQSLLIIHNHPTLMARRWAGQWDQAAITELRPDIANCTRKQLQVVLGHIGRVTSATTVASWREFKALARELQVVLGHIGRVTSATTVASWREFKALARELSPHPTNRPRPFRPSALSGRANLNPRLDPRLGEDHG